MRVHSGPRFVELANPSQPRRDARLGGAPTERLQLVLLYDARLPLRREARNRVSQALRRVRPPVLVVQEKHISVRARGLNECPETEGAAGVEERRLIRHRFSQV